MSLKSRIEIIWKIYPFPFIIVKEHSIQIQNYYAAQSVQKFHKKFFEFAFKFAKCF